MLQEPEEKVMLFSSMTFKRRQIQTKLQPTFERKQTNKLHLIFEVSCSFKYQGGCVFGISVNIFSQYLKREFEYIYYTHH